MSKTYHISIDSPASDSNVPTSFQASGTANPTVTVSVTLNGTTVNVTVAGDGTWAANFQNMPPGNYTITATINGTNVTATNFNINVGP